MKKSVLIALLGVSSTDAIRVNQQGVSKTSVSTTRAVAPATPNATAALSQATPNATATALATPNATAAAFAAPNNTAAFATPNTSTAAFATPKPNATAAAFATPNATAAFAPNATAAAFATPNATAASFATPNATAAAFATPNSTAASSLSMIEEDSGDIDKEVKEEMDQFDAEADAQVAEEFGSDEDSYVMLGDKMEDEKETAPNDERSKSQKGKQCKESVCGTDKPKHKNPHNSSDDDCACKQPQKTEKEKVRIQELQAKRIAEAADAKAKAEKMRAKAEAAIKAANEARVAAIEKSVEMTKKAEDATNAEEKAVVKKIAAERKAKQKVTVFNAESKDLRTKRQVHQWEEIVIAKHDQWATYKTIKKEGMISNKNVQMVRKNLKEADNKVIKLMKLAALNPRDVGNKEKIEEAKRLKTVIERQLADAKTQQAKIEEQKHASYTKAQMASVEAAKAKAQAEKAFRGQVVNNNKTCNLCNLGKEKIRKRRLEIEGAIKQEIQRKAARMADRKREHDRNSNVANEKRKQDREYYTGQRRQALVEEAPAQPAKPAPSLTVAAPAEPAKPAASLAVAEPVAKPNKTTQALPQVKKQKSKAVKVTKRHEQVQDEDSSDVDSGDENVQIGESFVDEFGNDAESNDDDYLEIDSNEEEDY